MLPNLHKWAFFYFSPGFAPQTHTVINRNDDQTCELISVGFDPSMKQTGEIESVAQALVDEGVQAIELCGGFGPSWVTRLRRVLPEHVPIGSVMYGPEDRADLLHIMQP